MDLTTALLRAGAARPHVLLAVMPGATAVRLAAEEHLRRRGWPPALTPADADILFVCGQAGERMAPAVAETWQAMPAPRAQASAVRPEEVRAALETARAALADLAGQRALAVGATHVDGGMHMDDMQSMGDMADMDMGGMTGMDDMAGMDMSQTDNGMGAMDMGHEPGMDMDHMDMGGMDMDMGGMMVRGLRTASRAQDRDGLRLDQLHLPLGPFLPDWPAGLLLRLTLQGDVIQEAQAEVLGGGDGSFWDDPWRRAAAGEHVTCAEAARRRAAARLDSLARLLGVAGWGAAATTARRLRDEVLAGTPDARLRRDVCRLARRVTRSRVLAWLAGGLGELSAADAASAGVAGAAARADPADAAGSVVVGDVTARYRRWCAELDESVAAFDDTSPLRPDGQKSPGTAGGGHAVEAGGPATGLVAVLPELLAGAELGAARLIVASLDPDLDQLPAAAESRR
jgi:hypothetical protein